MIDRDLRRALLFIAPYWRRLVLVLALSALSTALSLYLPLLSRDFFDGALIGRNRATLVRVLLLFFGGPRSPASPSTSSAACATRACRRISSSTCDCRCTGICRGCPPRFYARTRLGDVMSRINNDIGEIQRIAAETALAWVGNVLFLAGTTAILAWLDVRLFLVTIRHHAARPVGAGAGTGPGLKAKSRRSGSAARTSAAS